MAISQIDAYGLLDDWRDYCLENIWWFNQMTGTGAYLAECPVYVQPDRDVVARAIREAFGKMTTYLHYPPKPIFVYEDIPLGGGVLIERQELRLKYGHIQAVGQRATTLIEAGATIVYSDVGGLGVSDTATIAVTVPAATPTSEVSIFFKVSDGAPSAAEARYEIVPVTRSRSGNTVTLTAHRANFVKPNGIWAQPYENPNYQERNAGTTTDATQFITQVDVYRVYADDTSAVILVGDGGCSATCEDDTCTACARLIDAELGIIQVRGTGCACVYPERVRVHYKAGYPMQYGRIDPDLGIPLFRLANTLMPRQPCAECNRFYDVWVADRETDEGLIPPHLLSNPFGIQRGQIDAWKAVLDYAQAGGGKLTRNRPRW